MNEWILEKTKLCFEDEMEKNCFLITINHGPHYAVCPMR